MDKKLDIRKVIKVLIKYLNEENNEENLFDVLDNLVSVISSYNIENEYKIVSILLKENYTHEQIYELGFERDDIIIAQALNKRGDSRWIS